MVATRRARAGLRVEEGELNESSYTKLICLICQSVLSAAVEGPEVEVGWTFETAVSEVGLS